jgi:hypothetical protein
MANVTCTTLDLQWTDNVTVVAWEKRRFCLFARSLKYSAVYEPTYEGRD